MRTIIAGSRSITDYALIQKAVSESGFEITEVVSGGAIGVDRLGERWRWNSHRGEQLCHKYSVCGDTIAITRFRG